MAIREQSISDREASSIIDSLGIGIWKWDLATNTIEWEKNMYRLYEIDPDHFNGGYEDWAKCLSTETRARAIDELNAAVQGKKDFDTTFKIVLKTGEVREIRSQAFVIRDEHGKALKMCGINLDRSREAQLEEALQLEKDFTQSVLNSVTSLIAVINPEGVIIAVNEPWRRFSIEKSPEPNQPTPHTGVGSNYLKVFKDVHEDASRVSDGLTEVYTGITGVLEGRIPHFTTEYSCHTQHERRWYSMNVTPLLPLGRGAVITHTNITERHLSEQKLIQTSKLRSLGELSAGIMHEINNPLTAISLSIGLLSRLNCPPHELTTITHGMKKAMKRVFKIIGGLKKFSRNSEERSYSYQRLSEIIREALLLTESKSKENHASITFELHSENFIWCDGMEIEQVLINLIDNSIDAVKDHDQKWIKIHLALSDNSEELILQVADSGHRMSEEIQKKLFDPFFTTKPMGEGTGLGLSITKLILDRHQASIRVLPEVPQTCFEVRFKSVIAN